MGCVEHSVDNRVTHIDVSGGHINLCTKYPGTGFKFAIGHSPEEVKVFLNASVTVGAFLTGFCESASVFSYFFCSKVIYIGKTFFNELNCTFVYFGEIVRCVVYVVPVEAEPLDIFHNGVYIFHS